MSNKRELRNRINKIAAKEPSRWEEEIQWNIKNEAWLDKSAKIALKILQTLRNLKLSQKELAELLNVSPQHISKIVKGTENFTLETISKIENALNIKIIEIPEYEIVVNINVRELEGNIDYNISNVKPEINLTTPELYTETDKCELIGMEA